MEVMNAYASLMLMVIVLVALFLSWRRTNQRLPEEIREQAICPIAEGSHPPLKLLASNAAEY